MLHWTTLGLWANTVSAFICHDFRMLCYITALSVVFCWFLQLWTPVTNYHVAFHCSYGKIHCMYAYWCHLVNKVTLCFHSYSVLLV